MQISSILHFERISPFRIMAPSLPINSPSRPQLQCMLCMVGDITYCFLVGAHPVNPVNLVKVFPLVDLRDAAVQRAMKV